MPDSELSKSTASWYQDYYTRHGANRNDLLRNPGVLFQSLAADISIIRAIRSTGIDPKTAEVLDVGCGTGSALLNLIRLGFETERLHGIDLLPDRIAAGRRRVPTLDLAVADARLLPFPDQRFDLVYESTMFMQLTDDEISTKIAIEMIRATRKGGFILLTDWRYAPLWRSEYRALTRTRISDLFDVGRQTRWRDSFAGALVPPVGRTLSTWLPSLYFTVQRVFPFLAGQMTTVLERR